MEISEEHHDFETCFLEIDKLVDGYQVTKVDLTARFIPGIDPFLSFKRRALRSSSVTTSTAFLVTSE
jgi:hypothetical protein